MPTKTLFLSLALTACTGELTRVGASVPTPSYPPDVQPPGSVLGDARPPPGLPPLSASRIDVPIRRLSAVQYLNAVQDFVLFLLPQDGAPVAAKLPGIVDAALYPPDSYVGFDGKAHGGFQRADQAVQQGHVDASYSVALAVAGLLSDSPKRMEALLGACAVDPSADNDEACLSSFFVRAATRAFRRKVSADEFAAYRSQLSGTLTPELVAEIIAAVLCGPDFLYVIENGNGTNAADARVALSPFELATRLSLHFWNAPPDDLLMASVGDGSFETEAGYRRQVDRLALDARAEQSVREFFSQWFELHRTPALDSRLSDKVYRSLAGDYTPTAQAKQHAIDEINALVSVIYAGAGSLQDVLKDNKSYSREQDIATLYGVSPWDGKTEPVRLDGRNLMTRIAFLASGVASTRPILKGARILEQLLCQPLPPPPPAAMNTSVEFSATDTTRESTEKLTEQNGTSCAGCHKELINPFGFMTENYDSFGRVRPEQQLFDTFGTPSSKKAVNTATILQVAGKKQAVQSSSEATDFVTNTGLFESCFARQYFRYAFARKEQPFDTYVIDELAFAARNRLPLREVMITLAMRPEFRTRMSQ